MLVSVQESTERATAPRLPVVVGENLRRLRAARGHNQHECARHLRARHLAWSVANVASLESGRRETIDFLDLAKIAYAYGVPVAALLEGDGDVWFAPDMTISRSELRSIATGGEVVPTAHGPAARAALATFDVNESATEADAATATRLGVTLHDVVAAAQRLWGHTLTAEREKRLGPPGDRRTLRARRGRITRELTEEIRAHLGEGDGQ